MSKEFSDFSLLCQQFNSLPISISESWLSDQLSYFLDPSASHGLGDKFCLALLKKLIDCRCKNDKITTRDWNFKIGKGGKGKLLSAVSLRDTGIVREFYISDRKYIDIVMLNLERNNGMAVVIENKYLTHNSEGQLSSYRESIREMMPKRTIMEFVYLTLWGQEIKLDKDKGEEREWVKMSWFNDILPILRELKSESTLYQALDILKKLTMYEESSRIHVREAISEYGDYLCDELNRALIDSTKPWSVYQTNDFWCELIGPVDRTVRVKYANGNHLKISVSDTKRRYNHKKPDYIIPLGLSSLASISLMQTTCSNKLVNRLYTKQDDLLLIRSTRISYIDKKKLTSIEYFNKYYKVFQFLGSSKSTSPPL